MECRAYGFFQFVFCAAFSAGEFALLCLRQDHSNQKPGHAYFFADLLRLGRAGIRSAADSRFVCELGAGLGNWKKRRFFPAEVAAGGRQRGESLFHWSV